MKVRALMIVCIRTSIDTDANANLGSARWIGFLLGGGIFAALKNG